MMASSITFFDALRVWIKVAALSFGGPAGQIAVMHRILVEEKKWIDDTRFMHALNYCMLLPGPEAQQLATYLGWLLHRTAGGMVAGTLFILPGFVAIMALSIMYALWNDVGIVQGLFFGLKAAVIAVVVEAMIRIGKRALKNPVMIAIAVAAFVGLFFFGVPFPIIVIGAGVIGFVGGYFESDLFHLKQKNSDAVQTLIRHDTGEHTAPTWGRAMRLIVVGLLVWWTPVALLWWALGGDHVFTGEAFFFSKAAVVTFGGAYAVLPYVAQQAVERMQWLSAGQMLDGLGMAETTPGPLIMVVQFVGFMGAYNHPGDLPPVLAGVIGSLVTVWVTFVPCFLFVFLGAPSIERLRGRRTLTGALSSITAAVVGVIGNLAVWFALHTLFAEGESWHGIWVPVWSSANWLGIAIAAAALVAMLRLKVGLIPTLAAGAVVGVVAQFFG